mmetsp:Transcript_102450/g.290198  ORF Transcript_102450/g.290198 Transcript_102450/m.290198 type:complete len:512 (+) Transcript_102450:1521-3056(+)
MRRPVVRPELRQVASGGEGDGAERAGRHALDLRRDRGPPRVGEVLDRAVGQHYRGTPGQHHLRSALDVERVARPLGPVQDAHRLAVAVELEDGLLREAGAPVLRESHGVRPRPLGGLMTPAVQRLVWAPELLHEHADRRLRRLAVARELPLIVDEQARLVAQRARAAERLQARVLAPVDGEALDLANGRISVALYLACPRRSAVARQHELHDDHLIGGQRACLVGADDSGAAEGLYRRQLADDGVALRHLASAQRQARRDDGGQALGDGGHGQRHRDLEVVDAPPDHGAVFRVEEVLVVDQPHQHAHDADDLRQDVPKLVQFLLERRLLLVLGCFLHSGLDDADLRLHACSANHADARPAGDGRGGEQRVVLVLDHRVTSCCDDVGVLEHCLRLARELGLLDFHRDGLLLDDADVGRDLVANLDLDDVARHQVLCVDLLPLPVAEAEGLLGHQLLQGVERRFGVGLLPDANYGIQDQNCQDDERLHVRDPALASGLLVEVGEHEGYHRGHQ